MTQRLRIILPRSGVLVALAVFYLGFELPLWFIRVRWGVVMPHSSDPSDAFLAFTALAYGGYRVVAFHPFYRPGYHVWLSRTPWTSRKPLPLGPVSWVWEDGLILGGLAALCRIDGNLDPALIVAIALVSHAIVLTPALFLTGAWAFAYATAFVLGLAAWLAPIPWALLAAAVGANLLGQIGFRRSLARFPWYPEWQNRWWAFLTPKTGEDRSRTLCGWPYDTLRPHLTDLPRIDLTDAVLISMLAGWWLFALGSLIPDPKNREIMLLCVGLGGISVFSCGRLLLYVSGHVAPISLWGRIATFRWIIPGCDQIWIGPASSALALCGGLAAWQRWGVPADEALPIGFALMIFLALSSPPSLRRWRLTGRHRIIPMVDSKFIQVG